MGGLRTKKWTGSKANNYVTRGRACKTLQISLNAFRRLCILKGVYPQDPKKRHRRGGTRTVYYHVKDIKYLKSEALLKSWRLRKAYMKKLKRAKGRHDFEKLKNLQKHGPRMKLEYLVRERYPRFEDALRDLDDCLSMVHLFGQLSANVLKNKAHATRRLRCQKLMAEFMHLVTSQGLLKKSFVSVKGIYHQCEFQLEPRSNPIPVTFLCSHDLAHSTPSDVDFKVMSTFLSFYRAMLRCVNFKLYKHYNMQYPPFGHINYDATSLSLSDLQGKQFTLRRRLNAHKTLQSQVQAQVQSQSVHAMPQKKVQLDLKKILGEEAQQEGRQSMPMPAPMPVEEQNEKKRLFSGFVFLLNRETPQRALEFVILSLGGRVIMEQKQKNADSKTVTHQIVDRPMAKQMMAETRQYVQPQWVFDCLNTDAVIPAEHYAPNVQCPPHLSPFVTYDARSHKPSQAFVLEQWRRQAQQFGGFVPSKSRLVKSTLSLTLSESQSQAKDHPCTTNEDSMVDFGEILGTVQGLTLDGESAMAPPTSTEGASVTASQLSAWEKGWKEDDDTNESEGEKLETLLRKQRLEIADSGRQETKGKESLMHSLATDGIPADREEKRSLQIAKAFMTSRNKFLYKRIAKKTVGKSRRTKLLDKRRILNEKRI